MSRVISPTETADDATYTSIRDVAHVAANNAMIDVSVPFRLAELHVVQAVPDVELRTPPVAGKGRSYPRREEALLALICLAGGYMSKGGGRTASGQGETERETTGEVRSKSVTVGPVTERTDYHSGTTTSHTTTNRQSEISAQSQSDFLIEQAVEILQSLGGTTEHIITNPDEIVLKSTVLLTDSRLDGDREYCPETEQGSQPQPSESEVVGEGTTIGDMLSYSRE